MINMGEIFAHERIGDIEMERVQMNERERTAFAIREGDLLFARQSLIAAGAGKCSIVKRAEEGTTFESHLIRIRLDQQKVIPDFVFYYFLSPQGKANVQSLVMQVAAAGIRGSELSKLQVPLPPHSVQRRIAGVLSAYDELIENSQRRIRILETMVRSLHRKWFVEFRFPGHEKVRRVASALEEMPEGWEITTLGTVCGGKSGVQTGPFGSQLHESDYSDQGVPVVMPKNLIGFRVRTHSIARIPEETADKLSRHRMRVGDIVYGRRGDIGRRAYITEEQAGWLCGTGCLRIRPNTTAVNGWYLFNYLGQQNVVAVIAGRAQGVTMPNLNTGILASLPVIVPLRKLQDHFEQLTKPMADVCTLLTAQVETLRKTRDLLLPRVLVRAVT
jgi:type I restriction enzyme, S subunit